MQYISCLSSPLGPLLLRSDGKRVCELRPGGDFPRNQALFRQDLPVVPPLEHWLRLYSEGRDPGPVPVPLNPSGTPFQQQVFSLLRQIPYGQSVTYGDLACALSPGMSPQAVGNAVGKNPIAILIPCHRVLGAGRKLTGYAYGLDAKRLLLNLEHIPFRETSAFSLRGV